MINPEKLVCRAIKIPMRDGTILTADLYLGAQVTGPAPVVLIRTPYQRQFVASRFNLQPFLDRGYALMFQDVRGTGEAEGILDPLMNEAADGTDTIAWLIEQPWCNGQVGTTGASYMGGTQIQLAIRPVPGHVTGFLQVPAGNIFGRGMIYDGNLMALETAAPWSVMMAVSTLDRFPPDVASAIREDLATQNVPFLAPLAEGDAFTFLKAFSPRTIPVARHVPFWHRWLDNRENPDFFDRAEITSRVRGVTRPLMHFSGWYDLFLRNSLEAYTGITAEGATREAREGQRLIIGPWNHIFNAEVRQFPGADVDDAALGAAWMDFHLQGKPHPTFDHPVIIYVMGENRWRAEPEWPCRGTVPTNFYLHSEGGANSVKGNGVLSTSAPLAGAPADHFRSDPADPIRSLGGHSVNGGATDQRPNAHRQDILVYTTEPLEEDVEVTGEVSATVYAASSATDTDWFVRLIDVFPDGIAYNILSGGTRARYRKSRTAPEALTPDEVVAYKIDLSSTSNIFKKGHKIRVEIACSDFPNYDRNPNSFVDLASATISDFVVAEQTIFHDASRPSSITLPIIPAERERSWIDTPFEAEPGEHAYTRYNESIPPPSFREIVVTELPTS